jgi:hypothetical protein
LPASLPLTGQYTSGGFAPAGQQLPPGSPTNGQSLYTNITRRLDGGAFACVTCHTLPTGAGPDMTLVLSNPPTYQPLAVGPQGQHHLALVSVDGSTNLAIKTPQIRNAYLKIGADFSHTESLSGFGFVHDGSVDSIARFVNEPVFTPPQSVNGVASDQETADLVAFIMCMTGRTCPRGRRRRRSALRGWSARMCRRRWGCRRRCWTGRQRPRRRRRSSTR